MPRGNANRSCMLIITALFGWSVTIAPTFAAGSISPSPPPSVSNPNGSGHPAKTGKSSQKKHRHNQRSEREYQEYVDGYRAARSLVLDGKYAEAISAFRALGHDDSADVANYVGYAYRKLGDYELSKLWYEKALAVDPKHVRTWQYYALWHLEQGNKLKAQEFLEIIRGLCGDSRCQEYVDLQHAIDEGQHTY